MSSNFIIINPIEEQFIVYVYKCSSNNEVEILDFTAEAGNNLVITIQNALLSANLNVASLSFIGVINGPGSYTKIRIGVASANALGLALNIPIINISLFAGLISSVENLLLNNNIENTNYLVAIDNNKGGIFAQAFTNQFAPISNEIDCEFTKIKGFIPKDGKLIVLGNGQLMVKEQVADIRIENLVEMTKLNSKDLYKLAMQKYLAYNKENITPVAALYIKDPRITRKQ